ncbi:right-handed parallel beta-helix repeat-containing protein [Pendulispora rubella]|uniref:Right-handed parallel beta-helix repeat-containing protein n=1 Tax=Pendulispora rubella TaxID=2741070 RepID=A0ABZ2LAR1_9BACT
MRATTISSLLGFGTLAVFSLLGAGCPPSYFETCKGAECGQPEDDGGLASETGGDGSAAALPKITGVTISGNPSRTIRQGFGGTPTNLTTTVRLSGERLDHVTTVAVGNAPSALDGVISSKTSTELVFTLLVRHGAPIGSLPLKVTSPSGTATFSDAISITAITASPLGTDALEIGLDSSGTSEHPFRSLLKAAEIAVAGDTISLNDGIYDTEHGELFTRNGRSIPADITIKGESPGGTLLIGPSNDCGMIKDGLVLVGSARLENLVIHRFCGTGIVTSTIGTVTLKSVDIHDVGQVGLAANTETILDSVDISAPIDAIHAENAKLTIAHSHIHHSATGIFAMGGALAVTASEIDHHCCYPFDDREGSAAIVTDSPVTLTDTHIHDNAAIGLFIKYTERRVPVLVAKSSFSANDEAIRFSATVDATVRDTTFGRDNKALIHVYGASDLDLGKPETPGNNRFWLCDTCDGVIDSRFSPTNLKPITVFGNWWSLVDSIPLGCIDRDSPSGKTSPPRHWHIDAPGKCASSTGNRFFN